MSDAFSATPAAVERLQTLLAKKEAGTYLRVKVLGGGCSGLQYEFAFSSEPVTESDTIREEKNVRIVVDATSLAVLNGSALDYSSAIGNACFSIINPNASANCGCGNSFSVDPSLLSGM